MALFNRVTKAAIAPPPVKAAASGTGFSNNQIGSYYSYNEGEARNRAMSVPAISRARDLMASVIGSMPLEMYGEMWDETKGSMEEIPLAPRSWLRRMNPALPNSTTLSWLFDDIFFYGVGYLAVTSRTADGYPASFERLPAGMMTRTDSPNGPVFFAPSKELYFNGQKLDISNVIQFISGVQGIIYQSPMVIATALKLEASRYRSAASAIPSGVLRQIGGEPLSAIDLQEIGASFELARSTNQVAVLNEFLTYEPNMATPDKMLLIEAANYQALECARLTNTPSYLLGIAVGGYSYVSNAGARSDLWSFGVKPYAECIAGTLSLDNVLPRGTFVRFSSDDYLMGDTLTDEQQMLDNMQPQGATQ